MRTGGRLLVDALRWHGIDRVFCVPGESYLGALDAFYDTPEIEAKVLEYSIGAGGLLTLRSSAPLPPNADPGALAVSPDGRSLYALDPAGNGAVIHYSVGAGGALTLKSPPTVPAANVCGLAAAVSSATRVPRKQKGPARGRPFQERVRSGAQYFATTGPPQR